MGLMKACGLRPLITKGQSDLMWSSLGDSGQISARPLGRGLPCSRPISESSDSLSPDVVMPTAPATELEAGEMERGGHETQKGDETKETQIN